MTQRWRIKKGDMVAIRTGRDKNKVGEVIQVLRQEDRVVVKGINMVKRHTRPSATSPGGIIEKEHSLHVSNVGLLDPTTKKPTRVGVKTLENGSKVRYAKASGQQIDG